MSKIQLVFLLTVLGAGWIGGMPAAAVPSFTLIPGMREAFDLSGDGQVVVGRNYDPLGATVRWQNGALTVAPPPSTRALPWDVSYDGSVILLGARRWANGTTTPVNGISLPDAISADGSVVVGRSAGDVVRWENGTSSAIGLPSSLQTIGGAPADVSGDGSRITVSGYSTIIIGGSPYLGPHRGFLWDDGVFTQIGGDHTNARAISADGEVVVGSTDGAAFRWEAGALQLIPLMVDAGVVSGDGSVILGGSGGGKSAIWWEGGQTVAFDVFLRNAGLDITGWTLVASSVSDDGLTFAGTAIDSGGLRQAFIAHVDVLAVPEPGTLSLVALGFLGLAARRR